MRRPLSLALMVSALVGCRADQVPPTATALDDGSEMSAIPAGPYTPGTSYFGRNSYIEYIAGNLPVIFAAPHGGTLTPAEIPNRTTSACGGEATTVRDANTEELARAIRTAFHDRTGGYPTSSSTGCTGRSSTPTARSPTARAATRKRTSPGTSSRTSSTSRRRA